MSFTEIALILFVALIVFGPEDLPAIARSLGKMVYQARRVWEDMTSEVKDVWETPAEVWNESVKEPVNTVRDAVTKPLSILKSGGAAKTAGAEAPAPSPSGGTEELLSYDDLSHPIDKPKAENPLSSLPAGMVSGPSPPAAAAEDEKTLTN
ncbi:MAG: twin-arginine translocase TatA/TatE family subunit [Gracilibacteraceae bacterium]|jgi:Sec-independent protein translocase protein TatA|nr:twin-arginine translocase TatA/TatE family subunit [Gracilibacteraceae bacterium]